MEIMESMRTRHSVRQYIDKPIDATALATLQAETDACNKESGLHIQLVTDEPKAFSGFMAHYGKFSGVQNYFALIGKKTADLEEKCGYYGERLVLKAQQLGLNTCWVALTYSKVRSAYKVERGEKLCVVIAFGYGRTQGAPHRSKTYDEVASAENAPDWFRGGVEAALLAPTAVNQQKFHFTLVGDKVKAEPGKGMLTKMDLGIAKYHFEVGSGKSNLVWIEE